MHFIHSYGVMPMVSFKMHLSASSYACDVMYYNRDGRITERKLTDKNEWNFYRNKRLDGVRAARERLAV